jgi:hypothetical protein
MALTEKNLEQLLNLYAAYIQRFQEMQQIALRLKAPHAWRTMDGELTIGILTHEEVDKLTERFKRDLDEAELIIATARGLLATRDV